LAAAIILLFLTMLPRWRAISVNRTGMDLNDHTLVLVATFQNETGEADLDGVLETTVESELTQTPRIAIAPRERVDEVLRLMRQRPGGRVPPWLATEVCARDAGIRAAIIGEVRKVGAGYLLSMNAVRGSDGRVIISVTESPGRTDAIPACTRRLAERIRNALADTFTHEKAAAPSLDKVTTTSLEALRLYTDAERLGLDERWSDAEVLLRRAVKLDAQFASAIILLAWTIHNQRQGSGAAQYMPFAERALALADQISERESLFVRASYYALQGDIPRAIPYYEVLVRRYPDHLWALNDLLHCYLATGQNSKAFALSRQLIQLRPNDPMRYLSALPLCLCAGDLREAETYLAQGADAAENASTSPRSKIASLQFVYYSAVLAWLHDDAGGAKLRLDALVNSMPQNDFWLAYAATGYLTLGQSAVAERLFERIRDAAVRLRWRAWNALLSGDIEAARQIVQGLEYERPNALSAIAMIRAGRVDEAERLLKRLGPDAPADAATVARSEMLSRERFDGRSLERLNQAVQTLSQSPLAERYIGAQLLAQRYLERGDVNHAISVLNESTEAPRGCGGFPPAVFWVEARSELFRLYRAHGHPHEALIVGQQLKKLLSVADSNNAISASLRPE
jgi:predicted Zn-dependent protease